MSRDPLTTPTAAEEASTENRAEPAPPVDSPRPARRARAVLQAASLVALGAALPIVTLSYIVQLGGWFSPALGLGAIAFPVAVHRAGSSRAGGFFPALVVSSVGLAVFSFTTGVYNGLTNEAYLMPQFIGTLWHGQDPYATVRSYTYVQYGTSITVRSGYDYLPLYLVLQPFVISFKIYAMAAWGLAVYLVRDRPFARIAIGQPFVAVLAANGYNDLPVLMFLTIAFVGVAGRRQPWAEVLALGCKQFANAFVIGYYLARRELRRAAIAASVSVAFVLPFLIWDPGAFVCATVPLAPHACGASAAVDPLTRVNYYLWPLWALALFSDGLWAWFRRNRERIRRRRTERVTLPSS